MDAKEPTVNPHQMSFEASRKEKKIIDNAIMLMQKEIFYLVKVSAVVSTTSGLLIC